MNIFKKKEKEKPELIEKERDLLKITLEYVTKENSDLREKMEDLKITVKTNKDLLKEYIERITNKDKTVQKMNSIIEQLTERINVLMEQIKKFQHQKNEEAEKTINTIVTKQDKEANKNPNANYSSITNTSYKLQNSTPLKRPSNLHTEDKAIEKTTTKTQTYTKTDNADKEVNMAKSLNLNFQPLTLNVIQKQDAKRNPMSYLNSSLNVSEILQSIKPNNSHNQLLAEKFKEVIIIFI